MIQANQAQIKKDGWVKKIHTMGAKSIARRPPKVLNFEILELLTK
jgi:hypothetical protein